MDPQTIGEWRVQRNADGARAFHVGATASDEHAMLTLRNGALMLLTFTCSAPIWSKLTAGEELTPAELLALELRAMSPTIPAELLKLLLQLGAKE